MTAINLTHQLKAGADMQPEARCTAAAALLAAAMVGVCGMPQAPTCGDAICLASAADRTHLDVGLLPAAPGGVGHRVVIRCRLQQRQCGRVTGRGALQYRFKLEVSKLAKVLTSRCTLDYSPNAVQLTCACVCMCCAGSHVTTCNGKAGSPAAGAAPTPGRATPQCRTRRPGRRSGSTGRSPRGAARLPPVSAIRSTRFIWRSAAG